MKLLLAVFFCSMTLAAAGWTVPSGAVQAADGSFRYTDAQGMQWIYRRTPFGIARAQDMAATAIKATEAGDAIRFERPTPFGTFKWERRKTELTEIEQRVWNREKARAAQAAQKD